MDPPSFSWKLLIQPLGAEQCSLQSDGLFLDPLPSPSHPGHTALLLPRNILKHGVGCSMLLTQHSPRVPPGQLSQASCGIQEERELLPSDPTAKKIQREINMYQKRLMIVPGKSPDQRGAVSFLRSYDWSGVGVRGQEQKPDFLLQGF